jgi:segregation and condensation protein B
MKHEMEALLFATDAPLTIPRLKSIFPGTSSKELRQVIADLNEDYEEQERAFTIVEFGGGWQIASRPQFAPLIGKLFRGRRFTRLSKAGLEVLAIIAYRQPVTRMEIEDVRGVQCSGVLTTLAERRLITIVGRSETVGHPLLYGTTREFLNHLGLKGLHQLPSLPDIERIIDNRDDLRHFATQLGEELSETDLAFLSPESENGSEIGLAVEESVFPSEVNPIPAESDHHGERSEG